MSRPSLWDFSLAVYARDGVKAACLTFQDEGGDVNVGLFVCWAVLCGHDPGAVSTRLLETSATWRQDVVEKLRQARNALKPAPDFVPQERAATLRKAILGVELRAERVQQGFLEPLLDQAPVLDETASRFQIAMRALVDTGPAVSEAVRARFIETIFAAWKTV